MTDKPYWLKNQGEHLSSCNCYVCKQARAVGVYEKEEEEQEQETPSSVEETHAADEEERNEEIEEDKEPTILKIKTEDLIALTKLNCKYLVDKEIQERLIMESEVHRERMKNTLRSVEIQKMKEQIVATEIKALHDKISDYLEIDFQSCTYDDDTGIVTKTN